MKSLKVTINGKEITTESGKTILETVNEHWPGRVPTLCYDPSLPPYGSCFLCVVEIEGMNKLVPSCCSQVANGMKIHTDNEKISAARKTALELLLSNHYADCVAPCKETCPAGVDVQGYIALMAMGKHTRAVRLIKEKNPLPLVCGRICVRECEVSCRRNHIDNGVGIDNLKRFATDLDINDPWRGEKKPPRSEKVAVIGGGPAGLSCAHYLALEGYRVTIFDRSDELGGMLRYGIPEYRLPKVLLAKEIKWITDAGIDVKTNTSLGKDFSLPSLRSDGYRAIFLAIGAWTSTGMKVAGEDDTRGIISGIGFLHGAGTLGNKAMRGKVVVVIGGGNTAIDAARTSVRCNAKKVILLYRRTRKEMPALDIEVEAAEKEGIEFHFLSAPIGIDKDTSSRLSALTCIKMKLGEPDKSGRRRPVPIENSDYRLECDFAISAIGQAVESNSLAQEKDLKLTRWNSIDANEHTMETSVTGVFAGGDGVTGPSVAIDAIAHGRIAARSIHDFLQTGKVQPRIKEFVSKKDTFGELSSRDFEDFPEIKREQMPELDPSRRIHNFEEVELGLTRDQVSRETERCLSCGCQTGFDCRLRDLATEYGVDLSRFTGEIKKYKPDAAHPFINLDPNKCISCGRCTRTCEKILNESALSFIYRGFTSIVRPALEKPLERTTCISCGNCISTCPTGAISEKLPFKKPGPLATRKVPSICSFCSVGCNLNYEIFDQNIFLVSGGERGTHNEGYLCRKGRFGSRYLIENNRIIKPLVRKNASLSEVSFENAFDYTAKSLKEIQKKYGKDSVLISGSPKLTNEEIYLLQKFARLSLETNNVTAFGNLLSNTDLTALDESLGMTVSTATMDDLALADVIIVVNANLSEENLICELKIRNARRGGAKIVSLRSCEDALSRFSDLHINLRRGSGTFLFTGISGKLISENNFDRKFVTERTTGIEAFKKSIRGITPGRVSSETGVDTVRLQELYELISDPDTNVMVVTNIDDHKEKSKNDLKAIVNLLLLTGRIGKPGNGLLAVRDYANSEGLIDHGFSPKYLPGLTGIEDTKGIKAIGDLWDFDLSPVFAPVDLREKLRKGGIRAALIFGEDPLHGSEEFEFFSNLEFLLVSDSSFTSSTERANVVLPLSFYTETSGTFTSCDRRVQRFERIFPPLVGLENWQIIQKLSEKFPRKLSFTSTENIFDEIRVANKWYSNVKIGDFWGKQLFEKDFPTRSGKAKFTIYHLDSKATTSNKKSYLLSEKYFQKQIRQNFGAP